MADMRALAIAAMLALLPSPLRADASIGKPAKRPTAPVTSEVPPAQRTKPPECGTYGWQQLHDAVAAYCPKKPDPTKKLDCQVLRHVFGYCSDVPDMEMGDNGEIHARVADPRNGSYAWQVAFTATQEGYDLSSVHYGYDDCDAAGGSSPPPKGRIQFRKKK